MHLDPKKTTEKATCLVTPSLKKRAPQASATKTRQRQDGLKSLGAMRKAITKTTENRKKRALNRKRLRTTDL